MTYENLKKYGFTPFFEREAAECGDLRPARITEQHRELYRVVGEEGEGLAAVSGRFAYEARGETDYPAVGDWVLVDRIDPDEGNGVIHRVLPRRSAFERKAAGTARALQILAANIDVAFLCMSLNADFNLRRLERYLAVAWGGGATPVIVLTKADLCEDREARLAEVASVSGGAERILCSGLSEEGVREVRGFLAEGRTIAFLGSSGVGKSTLINRLMGREVLATGAIRPGDDRGRHTTTTRQLLLLPGGGVVIDTPGMRELQLDLGDLSRSFEDVEALAARCRYRDCTHEGEPGCAVRAALEAGSLSPGRLENYRKLRKELGYEGLSSREREREKIRNMFGGLGEMKQLMRHAKEQNRNRGRKGR